MEKLRYTDLYRELEFRAIRSQGPGGQHVNKVSTCVELRFNLNDSNVFTATEKEQLQKYLGPRLTGSGDLIIVSQASRSQSTNKEDAINKFFRLIDQAFMPVKKRRPTRPTRSSVAKRLEDKRRTGLRKDLRKNPDISNE